MTAQRTEGERRLVVAITGASGAVYGVEFLRQAVRIWDRVWLIVSTNGAEVARHELGLTGFHPADDIRLGDYASRVSLLSPDDLAAAPSSGSCSYDGLVVAPCSMGTLGRIASGVSTDLVCRVADVCLKERRRLVLLTRETPLSLIHLRNMETVAAAGATVMPAAHGFYHRPQSLQDVVDFMTARMLQALDVPQDLIAPWGESE